MDTSAEKSTAPADPAVAVRPSHPSDTPALYRICHATGLNGGDASALVSDPDLIGHTYVGPYAALEPELAFVAVFNRQVVGYVVGTRDSEKFYARAERDWFPPLRARYGVPPTEDQTATARFLRALHRGHPPPKSMRLDLFPAHLHIDLLPVVQGRGVGRRLLDHLLIALRESGVPGVHLYVSTTNPGAIRFYERVGFQRVDEVTGAFGYARALC